MKYNLSEQVVNNILAFLDRVDYKGFKEVTAINEIISSLQNPIKEEEQIK